MTQPDSLVSQLLETFSGDPWHGPSLLSALDDVDPLLALRRPQPDVHSIWELVLHVTAWMDFVADRLDGCGEPPEPKAGDFPAVAQPADSAAWAGARAELAATLERLIQAVRRFDSSRLMETVPGKPYTFAVMLDGVVWHGVYHAGQISLLKKQA